MDLAYELQEDYDAAILVDAVPRGGEPGTLYVIEPDPAQAEGMLDAHSMDPVRVLGLAKVLGSLPPRVLVVGCEPGVQMEQDDEELRWSSARPSRRRRSRRSSSSSPCWRSCSRRRPTNRGGPRMMPSR